ncbi:IS3 family transposase [Pedobacter sp. NJ-S-72]
MIAELRGTRKYYSIANLCWVNGYTRQAWYNHLQSVQLQLLEEHIVLEKIQQIRKDLPKTGCVKLHKELNNGFLQAHGISMGRDAVFDLVRAHGLLIKTKKKWVYTTNSFHRFKIHPDLVQRRPAIQAEEIWVSDITYLRTDSCFLYLSLVTDAYSRKIVGYHLSSDLKAIGYIKALKQALKKNRKYPSRPLIHHSDRGTQYCCDDYVTLLKDSDIQISMTQTGSPYDNAIAERINGILKMEFDLEKTFKNMLQAKTQVDLATYKYNNITIHASCNFQTPQTTHLLENVTPKIKKEAISILL